MSADSTPEPETTPIADRKPAWELARATLERIYRGKTVSNNDVALALVEMSLGRVPYGDPLRDAYEDLISHVLHLATELDVRGVDLATRDNTKFLKMSNDTMEIHEAMVSALVRLVGLRGVIRRRDAGTASAQ